MFKTEQPLVEIDHRSKILHDDPDLESPALLHLGPS